MSALQSTVTSASGRMMQSVMVIERQRHQAEHGHRGEQRQVHPLVGGLHGLVGGGHHADVAAREPEGDPVGVAAGGLEIIDLLDDVLDRRRLVVRRVDAHGHRGALRVHELAAQAGRVTDPLRDLRPGLRQHPPFRESLRERLRHRLHEAGKAAHRGDAVHLPHLEVEVLHLVHHLAVHAGRVVLVLGLGLGDDLQQVHPDREVAG